MTLCILVCVRRQKKVIENLFLVSPGTIQLSEMQKQEGTRDCGLFSIAVALALLLGENPSTIRFKQGLMRDHLLQCYNNKQITSFPYAIPPHL